MVFAFGVGWVLVLGFVFLCGVFAVTVCCCLTGDGGLDVGLFWVSAWW